MKSSYGRTTRRKVFRIFNSIFNLNGFKNNYSTGLREAGPRVQLLMNQRFPGRERDTTWAYEKISTTIGYTGLLFLAVNAILSAGAVGTLAGTDSQRGTLAFWANTGKYRSRFMRLVALASVAYWAAFAFWNVLAAGWVARWFHEAVASKMQFWMGLFRIGALLCTVAIISVIVDYAKVALIVEDQRSAAVALWRSTCFVVRHFLSTMIICLLIGLMSLAAIAGYVVFARQAAQDSPLRVALWFFVAEVFFWLRWGCRLRDGVRRLPSTVLLSRCRSLSYPQYARQRSRLMRHSVNREVRGI